jgi:hypothetical protein
VQLHRTLQTVLWLGFAGCIPAFGQFSAISTPASAYTGATTPISISAADGTALTSLTNGIETITFSTSFYARTVPSAYWGTWGSPPNTESSTPRVLANTGPITSVTLALSLPASTFGFEIEPTLDPVFPISVNYYNGSTLLGTVSRNVAGNAGALLMAASSGAQITSVVITLSSDAAGDAAGFAMAQFRYTKWTAPPPPSAVPTLSTGALGALSLLLAGAGVLLARGRRIAGA